MEEPTISTRTESDTVYRRLGRGEGRVNGVKSSVVVENFEPSARKCPHVWQSYLYLHGLRWYRRCLKCSQVDMSLLSSRVAENDWHPVQVP